MRTQFFKLLKLLGLASTTALVLASTSLAQNTTGTTSPTGGTGRPNVIMTTAHSYAPPPVEDGMPKQPLTIVGVKPVVGCDIGLKWAPLSKQWYCPPAINPDTLIAAPKVENVACAAYVGKFGLQGGMEGTMRISTEMNPVNPNYLTVTADTSSCYCSPRASNTHTLQCPQSIPNQVAWTLEMSACTGNYGGLHSGTNVCPPPPPPPPPPPTCTNGATDYPTCTLGGGGGTPSGGGGGGSCTNGATNYPTCTPPKCTNGATDYPTCTLGGGGGGTPVTVTCADAGLSGGGFITQVNGSTTAYGGSCYTTTPCIPPETGGPITTTYPVTSGGLGSASTSGVCNGVATPTNTTTPSVCPPLPPDPAPEACPIGYTGTLAHTVTIGQNPTTCAAIKTDVAGTCKPKEECPPADPPKWSTDSCPTGWSGTGATKVTTYTRGSAPACTQIDSTTETVGSTCTPPTCPNGASNFPICTPPTFITTRTCADYGFSGNGFITSTNGVVTSSGGTCSSTDYCAANESGGPIVTTIDVATGTSSTTGTACQARTVIDPDVTILSVVAYECNTYGTPITVKQSVAYDLLASGVSTNYNGFGGIYTMTWYSAGSDAFWQINGGWSGGCGVS